MMTATPVETIPPVTTVEALVLAETEYRRLVDQLRSLSPDDWAKKTDCPLWDVRAMAGHSVGMMSDFTSLRSLMRRMRAAKSAAKQAGVPFIDAMTAIQVADQAGLSTAELVARAEHVGPKAARWRARAPKLLRRMPMKEEVGGHSETWRMGYLLDTILTRDPWMHRVDIARATGRTLVLTPDHDGRIIADVVAEWARRHGMAFRLVLDGAAGGTFAQGQDGDDLHLDAVEFCRIRSGRGHGPGLLTQEVPF